MKRAYKYALCTACGAFLLAITAACNSDDSPEYGEQDINSSVAVTAFSLKENNAVLNNIDSVFFSIDLENRKIFNADSLPVGTDVSALAVTLSTLSCSECKLHFTSRWTGNDTVVDYLTNPDDKINFTRPVTLSLRSYSGSVEASYDIRVNVHELESDSLYWNDKGRLPMPGTAATEYRTVKMDDRAYSLSRTQAGLVLSRSTDVFTGVWEKVSHNLPASADVRSLTSSDNTLYIIADGSLLKSADGADWTVTGETGWTAITAAYNDGVLGLVKVGNTLMHKAYPQGATSEVDAGFPVSGFSHYITTTTKWAENPQVMIAGGRTASGTLTGATWAYDGKKWMKTGSGLPAGEEYAVTRYKIATTDTLSWQTSLTEALIAIGGSDFRGDPIRTVYVSRDNGMTWKEGSVNLRLPSYIPAMSGSDLLVFEYTAHISPTAVKPITQWQVPVLFLFSGRSASGLEPWYWQGVVNKLRFKPLQ